MAGPGPGQPGLAQGLLWLSAGRTQPGNRPGFPSPLECSRRTRPGPEGLRWGSRAPCPPGVLHPCPFGKEPKKQIVPLPPVTCLASGCPSHSPTLNPFSQRLIPFAPGCPRLRGGCGTLLCWGPACSQAAKQRPPPGHLVWCPFQGLLALSSPSPRRSSSVNGADFSCDGVRDSACVGEKFTPWSWRGERGFCARGFILVFPFPTESLLHAHLEMARGTQNHPSTRQAVTAPRKALRTARVVGRRQSWDLVPPQTGVPAGTAGRGPCCRRCGSQVARN